MVASTQTLQAQPATETAADLPTTVHGQLDDGQDFTQEFPFKQLGAAEWATMVSATADRVPAPLHELQHRMYVQTNHIPVVPVQPRAQCPDTHERPVDNKPWNLFMPLITLDPERHGPHVATICKQWRVDKLQVTAKQFWDLLCEWITMNRTDFERYEAGDHTHRIRAKLFVVPVEDCMLEWARPYVWDLRAYARDPTAEIHPMRQHDERRSVMNEAAVAHGQVRRVPGQTDRHRAQCHTRHPTA